MQVLQAFALWCACNSYPFAITDSSKVRITLLTSLGIEMTVSLQGQRAVGSIYLALDAWTSPNEVEVLGVLAFFQTKAGKGKLKDYVVLISFQM